MNSKLQYQINKMYNKFLTQLVLWKYFKNKVDKAKEEDINRYLKMMKIYEVKVLELLPEIQVLDRSKIKSCFPLVDDIALIKYFIDKVEC